MRDSTGERVVLVTGAGGGLGQALIREFATQNWHVAAGYRGPFPPDAEDSFNVQLDVTKADSIELATQQILNRWGRIDILVNNAGSTDDDASWQMADDAWQRVLDVNLKGAFLCCQAVCRPMIKQRDGHIINVSSFSGRVGQRGQANYAAAKAGLFGLTTSLARELGSRNVRVNAVLPGVLPTRMTADLSEDDLAQFAAANTLGRINSPTEVAQFVVFLGGTQNISGQVFQLDSRIGPWT
jgi:3-oxoacyl-[acyl-carrier protein] reductase